MIKSILITLPILAFFLPWYGVVLCLVGVALCCEALRDERRELADELNHLEQRARTRAAEWRKAYVGKTTKLTVEE